MYFKQYYLGCLAQASYLIGSAGEAVVVDPQRDVEQYLSEAAANGLQIKYVIETHLHADFVSGHRELAERTSAQVVIGAQAHATLPHLPATDGTELHVGQLTLRLLETPGHTPESISILVTDAADPTAAPKLLTGDTLFVGDVGRPDLVSAKGYTAPQMAAQLYDSLHEKILPLPDAVEVWPAHGKGSLCGRNMSNETSSTLGQQRRFNYAIQPMTKDAFVQMMTADLPEAPAYFGKDAEINRSGARALDELPPPTPLAPSAVQELLAQGAIVLDVRASTAFSAGHVPGALNIGLGGQFASWAGQLLPLDTPLVLVAEDEAQITEAVVRLARVGIETVCGYLAGGIEAWQQSGFAVGTIPQLTVAELHERLTAPLQVLDVRQPGEYNTGHVPGAKNLPLGRIATAAVQLDPQQPLAVICAGGYRSSAAASILARLGFLDLLNTEGGTSAWINAGYPIEEKALADSGTTSQSCLRDNSTLGVSQAT